MYAIKERDNAMNCIYCGKAISNWKSQFSGEHHYKKSNCGCGRENWIRMQFKGSGHDEFNNEKNLEIVMEQFRHDNPFA